MKICEMQLDREVINILRVIQCTVKLLMYFLIVKILFISNDSPDLALGDLTHILLITASLVMKVRVTAILVRRSRAD